jgi:hypothetical protein
MMAAPQLTFPDADRPEHLVTVVVDTQTAVTPGPRPDTATITSPDGEVIHVAGDYREVHARIQAAAARAHETGVAPQAKTPVN